MYPVRAIVERTTSGLASLPQDVWCAPPASARAFRSNAIVPASHSKPPHRSIESSCSTRSTAASRARADPLCAAASSDVRTRVASEGRVHRAALRLCIDRLGPQIEVRVLRRLRSSMRALATRESRVEPSACRWQRVLGWPVSALFMYHRSRPARQFGLTAVLVACFSFLSSIRLHVVVRAERRRRRTQRNVAPSVAIDVYEMCSGTHGTRPGSGHGRGDVCALARDCSHGSDACDEEEDMQPACVRALRAEDWDRSRGSSLAVSCDTSRLPAFGCISCMCAHDALCPVISSPMPCPVCSVVCKWTPLRPMTASAGRRTGRRPRVLRADVICVVRPFLPAADCRAMSTLGRGPPRGRRRRAPRERGAGFSSRVEIFSDD